MYVAMNHFRVAAGRGAEFEARWSERKSYLESVPGFVQFHLVRGKDEEDGTQSYASHVIWDSRQTFLDWTHSEALRKALTGRDTPSGLLLEHPRFRVCAALEL